jgi:hypothetical protein
MAIIFKNIVAQLIFNCPLLLSPRNNLAGKRLMTRKFLATPLLATFICQEHHSNMGICKTHDDPR